MIATEWRTSIDVTRFVKRILTYCKDKSIIKTKDPMVPDSLCRGRSTA